MKPGYVVLSALAAALMLASVAAGGADVARQRVAITTQATRTTSVSRALLTPLQTGTIKPDTGTLIGDSSTTRELVVRGGQSVEIYSGVSTFQGKRGSILMRFRQEYVEAGNGYHPATGTWKVVRGTGAYKGVTGGGRLGHVWLEWNDHWSSRLEGFLIAP
jgi:hypothetical protein